MKWTTITEYVDHETGEILTQREYLAGTYIKISTTQLKTEFHENGQQATRKFRTLFRKSQQQTIQFEGQLRTDDTTKQRTTTGRNDTN